MRFFTFFKLLFKMFIHINLQFTSGFFLRLDLNFTDKIFFFLNQNLRIHFQITTFLKSHFYDFNDTLKRFFRC